MNDWLGALTRASGIVATVLLFASIALGLLFSARETGKRLRPAWWLDLHNGISGVALAFTALHIGAAIADTDIGIGFAGALIPGAASQQWAGYAWGIIAFYVMLIVVFTSWPRKLLPRKTWRVVHVMSVPATVFACVHAYQLGSDTGSPIFQIGLPLLVAVAVYPLTVRLIGVALDRTRAARTPLSSSSHLEGVK